MGFTSERSSLLSYFVAKLTHEHPIDREAIQKTLFARFLTRKESLALLEELVNERDYANARIKEAIAQSSGENIQAINHLYVERYTIETAMIRVLDAKGKELQGTVNVRKLAKRSQDSFGIIRIDGEKSRTTVDIGFGSHTKTYAHLMTAAQRSRSRKLEAEARLIAMKERGFSPETMRGKDTWLGAASDTMRGTDTWAGAEYKASKQRMREALFGPPERY